MEGITNLLKRWLATARSEGQCLLCGLNLPAKSASALCHDCQLNLPRNTSACRRCGLPLPQSAERCGDCLREPPTFASCHTLFQYRHPVDHLIVNFKQHHHLPSERWLLSELRCTGKRLHQDHQWDALIATPLHWHRLWQRGFNQSYVLCLALAKELHCPILSMQRQRATQPQKQLGRRQRQQNLTDAFTIQAEVTGLRILLVDDVVTTGATANAIAHTLYRAGAARVDLLALARTPKPSNTQQT